MAQGLQLSDFRRTNYKLIVGVLILVLAVIFLPDLLNFSDKKKPEPTLKEETIEVTEEKQTKESSSTEQINNTALTDAELAELSGNGYIDRLADYKVAKELGKIPEGQELNPRDLMFPDGVTWKELKAAKTVKTLSEARKAGLELADRIGINFTRSRFALYNFANGIQSVISAKEGGDVREIVKYLESLDLAVSKTLSEEAVGREILLDWAKVSIASALGTSRADRTKNNIVPGFAPDINLSAVRLEFSPVANNVQRIGSGYQVSFLLIFSSRDVKNITVYRNGKTIKTYNYNISKNDQKLAHQEFQVANQDGGGIYTVIATDKFNYQFVKTYKFVPKNVKKLPWKYDNHTKRFILQFDASNSAASARLDSIFAIGSDSSEETDIFLPQNSGKYVAF